MKIYPLVLTFALAAAMTAVRWLAPIDGLRFAPLTYPGALLILVGAASVLWSAGLFRRQQTTRNPYGEASVLTTQGLYRFSRNPMYLGMLLSLLGLALLLGDALDFAGPLVFGWLTTRQIRKEEAALERIFGADYRDYKARVRRWL